jgi:hypothetical protein
MAAPVSAPIAPPINAPDPVLFGEPLGLTQPESKTAVPAAVKINVCRFMFLFSNHHSIQQRIRRFNSKKVSLPRVGGPLPFRSRVLDITGPAWLQFV